MSKYRIQPTRGGLSGYWTVQKTVLFVWFNLVKYSIFVYGDEEAYQLAKHGYYRLSQQNTRSTQKSSKSYQKNATNAPTQSVDGEKK